MTHPIETENLAAHVSLCQERYRALETRLERVENSLQEIADRIQDMQQNLHHLAREQDQQWIRARDVILGVVVTALGFVLGQWFF